MRKVRGRSFYSPQQVGFVVLSITRPQATAREERPGDEVGSESHRLIYHLQMVKSLKKKKSSCRDPGLFRAHVNSPDLNQGPSDLQSDALPTELSRQLTIFNYRNVNRTVNKFRILAVTY